MAGKFAKSFLKEKARQGRRQKKHERRLEDRVWSSQNKKPKKRMHIAR